MDLRRCRPDNIDKVMEIENASFEHPYSELVFYKFFGSDLFIVAERDEIVGYIIGDEKQGEGWIISIAVIPDERRKGIGRKLIEEIIGKFRSQGLDNVNLTVREGNSSAQRFYKDLGFEISGIVEDYYKNGDDAILMEKDI